MTATTMLKRIGTARKEIARMEKEIARYEKEWCAADMPAHMVEEGKHWIAYYRKLIEKQESKIAEMSKEAARLATADEEKALIKAKAEEMAKKGFKLDGYTTRGLHYSIYHNLYGETQRTAHCYSMAIEGMGTVFTSGTLETVAEYIIKN